MICLILRWCLRRFWEFNNILKSMQSESCSSFNIETRGLPASNWEGHHRLHASLLRRQVWSLSGKGYKYVKYYNNMTGKFERPETSCTSLLHMLICVYSHWSIANKLLLLKHLNYHSEIELKQLVLKLACTLLFAIGNLVKVLSTAPPATLSIFMVSLEVTSVTINSNVLSSIEHFIVHGTKQGSY